MKHTEYHVGCGIAGIYAGTLDKDKWINKSDVTDEAISAVAQYLLDHNISLKFEHNDKKYKLHISEV